MVKFAMRIAVLIIVCEAILSACSEGETTSPVPAPTPEPEPTMPAPEPTASAPAVDAGVP